MRARTEARTRGEKKRVSTRTSGEESVGLRRTRLRSAGQRLWVWMRERRLRDEKQARTAVLVGR
eukprot:1904313-Rhodomonas_salina.1